MQIFQRMMAFKSQFKLIDNVTDEKIQNLERLLTEVPNYFSLDSKVESDNSLFTTVVTQYESKPELSNTLEKFKREFHQDVVLGKLENLKNVSRKVVNIKDNMNLEKDLPSFYAGRRLVDQTLSEDNNLSEESQQMFHQLWDAYRAQLLDQIAGGLN
jgi:hypothetical protein